MKKKYLIPQMRAVRLNTHSLLAGSPINDGETDTHYLYDEILDGDDIIVE